MADYNDNAQEHFTVPAWIADSLTLGDIPEVASHGCDSGAYMPAVTYREARRTMWQHGDEITDFIGDHSDISCAEILQSAGAEESHSLMCTALASYAVELWCHMHSEEAQKILDSDDND